jgi:hypothetical protein
MQLGSRYFRDKLIELDILAIASIGIFWDWFHGRRNGGPGEGEVLIFMAIIIPAANAGLIVAMVRAKKREETAQAVSLTPCPRSQNGRSVGSTPSGGPSAILRRRIFAVGYLGILGMAGMTWNWGFNRSQNETAFLAPMLLVYAITYAIIPDDPRVFPRPIPLRFWVTLAVSLFAGVANWYALSLR